MTEPEVEGTEHKDDPDVCCQPLPEMIPEEQHVHSNDDGNQGQYEKRDGRSSHGHTMHSADHRDHANARKVRTQSAANPGESATTDDPVREGVPRIHEHEYSPELLATPDFSVRTRRQVTPRCEG